MAQMTMSRRKSKEPPIHTWDELRTIMRKHFMPSYYDKEIEIGDLVEKQLKTRRLNASSSSSSPIKWKNNRAYD